MTHTADKGKKTREERTARRSERFDALARLWTLSSLRRVRSCRLAEAGTRCPVSGKMQKSDGTVAVVVSGSGATATAAVAGVQSCGSVWACPVCSEKVQAERNTEIRDALTRARQLGWRVGFLTYTVRHRRAQGLGDVWAAVGKAWRAATSGSGDAWKQDKLDFGVRGYIRLIEVTHGENGWHVHVHTLVFMDPARSRIAQGRADSELLWQTGDARPGIFADDVEDLAGRMFTRWCKPLAGTSFRPSKEHGVNAKLVTSDGELGRYFAKNVYNIKSEGSAANDVTSSHAKQARHGNVTPFGLLARVMDPTRTTEQARRDLALWHVWETVSKGKRQLLWSNGLRDLLGAAPERSDEEIAEESMEDARVAVRMQIKAYRRIAFAGKIPAMLDAAERDDNHYALYELLHGLGVPWWLPDFSDAA